MSELANGKRVTVVATLHSLLFNNLIPIID